jgi:hypothetical protein
LLLPAALVDRRLPRIAPDRYFPKVVGSARRVKTTAVYYLKVFLPGDPIAVRTVEVKRASETLTRVPELLKEHDGCERIVVFLGPTRLFAVDCDGNRVEP